jgi:hypothetical protein
MTDIYYIDDRTRKTTTHFVPFTFLDKMYS